MEEYLLGGIIVKSKMKDLPDWVLAFVIGSIVLAHPDSVCEGIKDIIERIKKRFKK